jgi:hypothetical protein
MTRIKLPRFVNGFTDRHGKARYYFRRPGHKAVALPGLPYTTEFMDAYKLALAGITAPRTTIGSDRLQSGSVAKVVAGYLASVAFNALAPETKRTRRNILERFREQHGEKQVKLLRREHIVAMIEAKAATPSASRNLLNTLRVVNGKNAHPLYVWLKQQKRGLLGNSIKWNFTKFLLDKAGVVRARFAPMTKPERLVREVAGLL